MSEAGPPVLGEAVTAVAAAAPDQASPATGAPEADDETFVYGDDDDDLPWRLLLLEDCDELIRGDVGQPTSQSLSRLLNLTDGMLGQGRQVLVAITTNEDVRRLHQGVLRPGRVDRRSSVFVLLRRRGCGAARTGSLVERRPSQQFHWRRHARLQLAAGQLALRARP